MVTIKEIAKKANVSIAAVSMAINNKPGISKETSKRILDICTEMEYIPSSAAKSLKIQKSKTIGLLTGDISNPYFTDIIKGVEKAVQNHGYCVIICTTPPDSGVALKMIDSLVNKGIDGLFLNEIHGFDSSYVEKIQELKEKIPVFGNGADYRSLGISVVGNEENVQIEKLLTKLIAAGHTKIGCVGGTLNYSVTKSRAHVFKVCLEAYGLYNEDYVIYNGYSIEEGNVASMKLLIKNPEITAVMCMSDTIAIGTRQAAIDLNKRIPADLSLFGIDGIAFTQYFHPRLTTVDLNRYQVGYSGAERLIGLIEGRYNQTDPDICIDTHVIDGDTITQPNTTIV